MEALLSEGADEEKVFFPVGVDVAVVLSVPYRLSPPLPCILPTPPSRGQNPKHLFCYGGMTGYV